MANTNSPVELGQVVQVQVDASSPTGEGIAHIDEFVIFVTGAKVGQTARVKITKVGRTFAQGQRVG